MIHPSYSELIEAINANTEDNDNTLSLNSRYSLVLATSKRARQLIAEDGDFSETLHGKKPLSMAIEELYEGKVKILDESQLPKEEAAEGEGSDAAEAGAEEAPSAESEDGIAPEEAPAKEAPEN